MSKIVSEIEMKEIQLEMLDYFHEFCVKNNIKYFLGYGSLLGAIRHNGYIPWDDDIDLWMMRSDYEALLNCSDKFSNDKYRIVSTNDEGYYLPIAKVVDKSTVLKEKADVDYELGVYIDIFPIDNLGGSKAEADKNFHTIRKMNNKLKLKLISIRRGRKWYKNFVLRVGKFFLKSKSVHDMAKEIDECSKAMSQNVSNIYVGNVSYPIYDYKDILKGEFFEKVELHEFEGRDYYILSDYDNVLSDLYGDYMQLPPIEQRNTHHSHDVFYRE